MLHLIAEDATPLLWTAAGVALVALVLLRLTQQGKFLVVALGALALGVLAFAIESVWVTDDERVSDVVYALARAAGRGDVDRVLSHLAPEVVLSQGPVPLDETRTPKLGTRPVQGELARGEAARTMIGDTLRATRFDWLAVSQMAAHANPSTGGGTASFRVIASGSIAGTSNLNFATDAAGSDWSLGLRQTSPGVWQVSRITAVRLPFNASLPIVHGPR
jgi:hypothetical protein